jgi:hypothetical protein
MRRQRSEEVLGGPECLALEVAKRHDSSVLVEWARARGEHKALRSGAVVVRHARDTDSSGANNAVPTIRSEPGRPRKAAPVVIRSNASRRCRYCATAHAASASSTTLAWGAPPPAAEHSSVTVWVPAPTTADAKGDTDASTMVNPPAGEA